MPNQMQKISIKAQFRFDILQIYHWELLLACPGVLDHTHMNGLNHVDVIMYA